jgi:predicted GNAT family acetyltransferase
MLAVAEYVRGVDELVLTRTFVPPALRGRGLAETLVRAALDFARAERLRVIPACSYVAAFVDRHPELVAPLR